MNKFPFVAFMALTLEVFSTVEQKACATTCPVGSFCKVNQALETAALPTAAPCPGLEAATLTVFPNGYNDSGDQCPHAIWQHCLALPGYYRNIGQWNYGKAEIPIEAAGLITVKMDNGNRDYQTPILWWNPQNIDWKSDEERAGAAQTDDGKALGFGFTSKNAAKKVGSLYKQDNKWTDKTNVAMKESTYGSPELFVQCKAQASTFGAVDTRMPGQSCQYATDNCPAGTYFHAVGGAQGCWPCPKAKPYSKGGVAAVASCLPCEPGWTSISGTAAGPETLCPIHPSYPTPQMPKASIICPNGFFCTGAQKTRCPKLQTSRAGSKQSSDCMALKHTIENDNKSPLAPPKITHPSVDLQFQCAKGWYPKPHKTGKEAPGFYPAYECEECPQSSYCPPPSDLKGNTKKIDCDKKADVIKSLTIKDTVDTSKMANLTGQWSASYCRCPQGTHLENNKCTICPVGYMCHGNAKIECKWCTKTGSKQGAATTATQASAVSLLVVFCYIFILTPLRLVTA